jgi:hypothetical protein
MSDIDPPSSDQTHAMPGRFGIGLNVAVQVLLTLLIFAGVNWLAFHYYKRWDLTPAKSHTLSGMSLTYLRKLGKEVDITLVYPRTAPLYEPARALLEEYQRHGKRLVKVEEIDPVRDIDRAEQLKLETGLTLAQSGVLVRANNRQRYLTEEELVVRDSTEKDRAVAGFRGEDAITSALVGLMEGHQKRLYLVVGKGARTLDALGGSAETLTQIASQQNFELMSINLASSDRVPEDASAVLLVGPRYDLAQREMEMLRDYWQGERAGLLVLLDPGSETPRLNAWLSENGVTPRGDRVLMAQSTSAGPRKEFAVEAVFSAGSPITQPLADALIVLPGQTQSLDVAADDEDARLRDQSIRVTPIMRAVERFWGERDYLDALPVADPEEGDTLPPVDVAASVERGSAPDERLRVDSSRMVVVGNADLLNPEAMLAESLDFATCALNWMSNRERLMNIPAKPKNAYRIHLNPRQSQLLFALTTFLLPALALGTGWLVWLTRRSA